MKPDPLSFVYGTLDLILAAIYIFLFLYLIPARGGYGVLMACVLGIPAAAAAVGMFASSSPWGRKLALLSSIWLIMACLLIIALLISSAAYLHGIYGGVGQAGSALAVIIALLTIEVVGLVPALQVALLWSRRRAPVPEP